MRQTLVAAFNPVGYPTVSSVLYSAGPPRARITEKRIPDESHCTLAALVDVLIDYSRNERKYVCGMSISAN